MRALLLREAWGALPVSTSHPKFTPGPWVAQVDSDKPSKLFDTDDVRTETGYYEALAALLRSIEHAAKAEPDVMEDTRDARDDARAALAKAVHP